ncbi:hypothetical protein MX850_06870 [Erysipelothrix sp. Poltava]|nr:hypothetical protein MX850_06870 [Erysipelothrix sp. Poltava]
MLDIMVVAQACVFRDFEKIEKGDTIKLHRKEDNTTYIYKVYDNFEVPYTDTSVLNDDESRGAYTYSCNMYRSK